MTARRPTRLKTFDYRGRHRYFVTCTTDARHKLFVDGNVVAALGDQILRTCAERSFGVITYVFMEDHLHLLVEGKSEDAHFVSMMTLVRQRTAIEYRRQFKRRLWQGGYFERVLRPTDGVFAFVRYIQDNPANAGLPVERSQYPFVWREAQILTETPVARGFSRASVPDLPLKQERAETNTLTRR